MDPQIDKYHPATGIQVLIPDVLDIDELLCCLHGRTACIRLRGFFTGFQK